MRAAFDVRQGRLGHWPLWPGKMRDGRTVRLCYPALNRKVALSGLWPSLHTAARSPESADVSLGRSWSRPRSAGARLPARSDRRAAFGIPCRRNAGRAGLFIDRTRNHATPAVSKPMIFRPMACRPCGSAMLRAMPPDSATSPPSARARPAGAALWIAALDRGAPLPLSRQLAAALRAAIAGGQLRAGARLPSTRALAAALGLARSPGGAVVEARAAGGVRSGRQQIVLTAGTQQGLSLAARVLLDPGDAAWVEDPCYRAAIDILRAAEARIVPVAVDHQGLNTGGLDIGAAAQQGDM